MLKLRQFLGEIFNACRIGGDKARRSGDERCSVHSFASCRERALSDFRGIRMFEQALADERGRVAGRDAPDPLSLESELLIAAARKSGCFVDYESVPGTRYSERTGESEVRIVQSERVYYKIKNPFAKSHLKKHPVSEAIYEHIVHNILFPETPLEFIGVTEFLHQARIVYRQAAILSDHRPTDKQIAEHLSGIGLLLGGRYAFENEWLFVTDVGQDSDNVLLGDDDKLYFIDPIIGFKISALEVVHGLIGNLNS